LKKNGRVRVVAQYGHGEPLARRWRQYWDGLIEGRSRPGGRRSYSTEKLTTSLPARCTLHPTQYMDRKTAPWDGAVLAMPWLHQRWRGRFGPRLSKEGRFRVGVDMGTGIGVSSDTGGAISYATRADEPALRAMIIPNMAAGRSRWFISRTQHHGQTMRGIHAHAGDATRIIQHGDADVMSPEARGVSVRGGISAFQRHPRLVDAQATPREGTVPSTGPGRLLPGEGAGKLVLESIEHAMNRARDIRRGLGFATTCDAFHRWP